MRFFPALFAISAATIFAVWFWLGAAAPMPGNPVGQNGKLYCLSYAPFRAGQSPLNPATRIEPQQIDEDLTRLATLTGCVRTYSVDFGLDRIAEIAGRHGLKVIQGLWLSGDAEKNRYQVETAVALANKY